MSTNRDTGCAPCPPLLRGMIAHAAAAPGYGRTLEPPRDRTAETHRSMTRYSERRGCLVGRAVWPVVLFCVVWQPPHSACAQPGETTQLAGQVDLSRLIDLAAQRLKLNME